jgi:hypothetical protein
MAHLRCSSSLVYLSVMKQVSNKLKNPKYLVRIGVALDAIGLVTLLVNFFNMYNLVTECPGDADTCQAYSNWKLVNKLGLFLVFIGIVLLLVFLYLRSQKKISLKAK